jgi:two-component system CheB/CheR fusion protein
MLLLEDRPETDIVNHTIDVFFESLAKESRSKAIGVILSGMGSDGANGSLKIYENGGEIFVQEPASAAFSMMPLATIRKDHPDFILPPKALGSKLAETILRRQTELVR